MSEPGLVGKLVVVNLRQVFYTIVSISQCQCDGKSDNIGEDVRERNRKGENYPNVRDNMFNVATFNADHLSRDGKREELIKWVKKRETEW